MSHRSRVPTPQRDGSGDPTAATRSSIPVRPRLDTRVPSSESRRRGLPSSPRQHLDRVKPLTISKQSSARPSPNLSTSRSSKRPSPLLSSETFTYNSDQQSMPQPAEDIPLLFDRSFLDESVSFGAGDPQSAHETEGDTVFGVVMPSSRHVQRDFDLPPRLIPELRALASHVPKQTRPPAPPSVSTVGSPSTRFTESPAPWSASTATTTPLSWSSASPALTQTHGLGTPDRRMKTVPQPTPPRSRLPKLPTKIAPKTPPKTQTIPRDRPSAIETPARPRRKKSILDSPAPTPPPRSSSVKREGRSGNSSIDENLSRAEPSRPSTAPSSAQRDRRAPTRDPRMEESKSNRTINAHEDLQTSMSSIPVRPSRSGTLDLGESRPAVLNTHRGGFSPSQRQLLESGFEEVTRNPKTAPSSTVASDTEQSVSSEKAIRSPSRLGKFSRLKLFGQRDQTVDTGPNKLQRRGPAAGTGHEGYGKHVKRGRKQSTESLTTHSESERSQSSTRRVPLFSHARKDSTTSRRTSRSDLDEFAVPRLRPVVMRGGSQTSVASEMRDEQGVFASQSSDALPRSTPSRGAPSIGRTHEQSIRSGPVRPATAQESGDSRSASNLAARRFQRFAPNADVPRLPAPIRTDDAGSQPAMSSYDTTVSSTMPSSTIFSTSSGDHYRMDPSLLKEKKVRRKWWNPFKSRTSSSTATRPTLPHPEQPQMSVSIAPGPAPRTIPYYAMLESESDVGPIETVGQVLAAANNPTPPSPSPEADFDATTNTVRHESVLLPAAPSTDDLTRSPPLEDYRESPLKQPRLAQIGRIPKVVTRTEREHKPSRQSFSQPFSKSGTPEPWMALVDEPPLLQIHTDVLLSRPFREADNLSAKPESAPARTREQPFFPAERDVLDLLPVSSLPETNRSTSSSSAGLISIMGPPILPNYYAPDEQRQVPLAGRMSGLYGEDVWNEYDDIIDHVMSPSRSRDEAPPEWLPQQYPRQIGSPLRGSPQMSSRARSKGKMRAPEPRQAFLDLPTMGTDTPPVMLPSPNLPAQRSTAEEIRIRRSRIISALHSSYNPSSPFSMREFLKDYSEVRDSTGFSERLSTSTAARSTLMAGAQLEPSKDTHRDNAAMLDISERLKDPIMQSELHYASLEVSRWLSFGRVLFSPAQDEINVLPDRNILVIDGLGNEDWAIYCAVTVESARAVVYDLKETSHYKQPRPIDTDHLPSNLRRATMANFAERFPFHTAFFSVIVLRFPPAMSEATMKNIITECRRILVPGGHIEIMLLDMDFVNMGVQTRRAVRELKMRMGTKNPEVNLKPTIDHFQNVLGSRGFTGLNRCIVGVPVVGKAPGSTDSSTSSTSSNSHMPHKADAARTPPTHGHGRNFSLSDLVTDSSERADAQIGRMVSKTARNWWQHCYEASVLPGGDVSRSIFEEKRVMQECTMRGSSFKLLIAYAQRPVFETQSKRRTMSESAAGTPAVSSGRRGRLS